MTDGFTYQKRKPARRKAGLSTTIEERLKARKQHLDSLNFFCQFDEIWQQALASVDFRKPAAILCLGLGSLTSWKSRDQFLLLQHCVKLSQVDNDSVKLVDPAFDAEDLAYFQSCGYSATTDVDSLDLLARSLTLFYMPLCPRSLYEKLLGENKEALTLHNVILLGNDLLQYNESVMRTEERERIPLLLELPSSFQRLPIPLSDSTDEAFPGISLQWLSNLQQRE